MNFEKINGYWTPMLEVKKLQKINETKKQLNTAITVRLTTFQVEDEPFLLYSYGVTDLKNPPGHGGEWSSRCEIINQEFDTDLTEIKISFRDNDYFTMGISKSDLVLPNTLEYRNNYIYSKNDDMYPESSDYFRSTLIDEEGNMLHPTIEDVISNRNYLATILEENHPRLVKLNKFLTNHLKEVK